MRIGNAASGGSRTAPRGGAIGRSRTGGEAGTDNSGRMAMFGTQERFSGHGTANAREAYAALRRGTNRCGRRPTGQANLLIYIGVARWGACTTPRPAARSGRPPTPPPAPDPDP